MIRQSQINSYAECAHNVQYYKIKHRKTVNTATSTFFDTRRKVPPPEPFPAPTTQLPKRILGRTHMASPIDRPRNVSHRQVKWRLPFGRRQRTDCYNPNTVSYNISTATVTLCILIKVIFFPISQKLKIMTRIFRLKKSCKDPTSSSGRFI